jgi:cell division protein FtsZ
MIAYSREPQTTIPTSSVKIIGLGGAGANMLERVALDGLEGAEMLALNTDVRTLSACMAAEKIQLGRNLTKGLGCGGDPDLGQQAMLEAENEIRASLKGRRIVFLCVGLGGGTGSGAAPIITRIAREEGAFVVVFATMPFAFEGRRRREQAETALNELAVLSNALVTFDNNRMGELVLAKQGIHEAFAAADRMISESIKAVIRLVVRPGLINVGLDDLMSALRTTRSRCLFGSGLAHGKDRASRALKNVLASPLLDQGALLKEARTVLVHLCGGEDLTLYEIELLMQRLQKYVPERAHVLFGAAIDPSMGDGLSITLISALPEDTLAAGPRDALSRAVEDAELEPSDGFSPAPVVQEVAKAEVQPIVAEQVKVPQAEQESTTPDPDSIEAWLESDSPASTPVAPPPLPESVPVPKPTYRSETPESKPAARPVASLFDDRPFAESVPAHKPEPVEVIREEPQAKVVLEPAESFADEIEDEDEADELPAQPAVAEKPAQPTPSIKVSSTDPEPFDDNPFTFKGPDLDEVEPEWLNDDADTPDSEPVMRLTPADTLKLRAKTSAGQGELSFEGGPRGRFEGESPNVVDGEDLDIPPFLRKKR